QPRRVDEGVRRHRRLRRAGAVGDRGAARFPSAGAGDVRGARRHRPAGGGTALRRPAGRRGFGTAAAAGRAHAGSVDRLGCRGSGRLAGCRCGHSTGRGPMKRQIYTAEHETFRELARTFLAKEVVPHHEKWEAAGVVDREVWLAAGRAGLLGFFVDEKYGGSGVDDLRYHAVFTEEAARAGASGPAFGLHNDIIGPYLTDLTNEEQKQRWLPGFCTGEIITAIAMTEPGAGSDLQGIRTTAVRDGDDYVLNGQKTFISNGILADLVIVVARTDPSAGYKGISLLVVERGMPGFERGRNLAKIGQKAQDTAELFFADVRVPAANLLGEEGQGFLYLMRNLPAERLSIAI